MSQKDKDRPDLNRREKHGLEIIMACASEMHKCSPDLKARLTMRDRRGYAYFKMAIGLLDKSLSLIYEATPVRQLNQMYAICKSAEVQLNTSPVLTPTGYTAVKDTDLNYICGAAVNNKCAICVKDGMESRRCELRKTLMTIWPPLELPKFGDCPYQGVHWFEDASEVDDSNVER